MRLAYDLVAARYHPWPESLFSTGSIRAWRRKPGVGVPESVGMLLALPLTVAAGPIVAHNAVMLLAPALDGWAAFVLCRYLARSYWPAWLGGYILSFLPLHTWRNAGLMSIKLLVFPIPLIGWMVLRRLAGEISAKTPGRGDGGAVNCPVRLFHRGFRDHCANRRGSLWASGCSSPRAMQRGGSGCLFRLSPPPVRLAPCCYRSSCISCSPSVFSMASSCHHGSFPRIFSGSLFPLPSTRLGEYTCWRRSPRIFAPTCTSRAAYISLPLFLIVALYARSHWRTPAGRLLVDLLIILCVLTMGPWLEIAGRITIGLPWLVWEIAPAE